MKLPLRDVLENWSAGAWGNPSVNQEEGVCVLRSTNFRAGGVLSFENEAVLDIDEVTLNKKRLQPKDILLERSGGGPLQPVGRVAMFRSGKHNRFICGNFISRLVPREVIDADFLFYQLHSWYLDGLTEKYQTATTGIRNLQMQQYLDHKLWCPSLQEQRRIAADLKTQLDAVEAARVAACGQLAEVAALKKQVFNRLFSQIQNTVPIGSVAKLQSGYAFKSTTFLKQGTRLLRNANILPGKVYWTDQVCLPPEEAKAYPAYALEKDDVLISLDRPIISSGIKVARVLESDLPALLVQRVGRFQINPTLLDSNFLYAFLQTQPFIDAVSGHDQSLGVPHVSPKQIESVEMPLPSLSEQKRLAKLMMEITQKSDQAKQAAVQQLADLEQLPRRLLARAFDGKA